MWCVRTNKHGSRKLVKKSYIWELQECLREKVDQRCAVYTVYDRHGKPYIVVDAPCPTAPGKPYARFIYHNGTSHDEIAKSVHKLVSKYPGTFLPSIYGENFMEKWVQFW
ncbi:hypothetical protein ACEPAG_8115 [Sanghuangporus baumii]